MSRVVVHQSAQQQTFMGGECGAVSELSVCYFIFHLHGWAFNAIVKENSIKTLKGGT